LHDRIAELEVFIRRDRVQVADGQRGRQQRTAALPVSVRLSVLHPTREGFDHRGELVRGPDGTYAGQVTPIAPGRWLVAVETDEWRLPVVETNGAVAGAQ